MWMGALEGALGEERFRVLEAAGPSRMRPDAHPGEVLRTKCPKGAGAPCKGIDCLHFLLPGVPDVWNTMLGELL